jgi:hypothetical protein
MLIARRTAGVVALLVAMAGAPPADVWAQTAADVAQARDLFTEASELAQQGKWDEARELYARSLALKRAPITLYSLGIAQRNTGRMVEALENLRAFLAEPSVPATQPYEQPAREAIADLERRVARITMKVEPPGVADLALRLDGVAVSAAAIGVARPIDPGVHEVIATAPGRREARVRVTVAEGGHETVALTLVPAAAGDARADHPPQRPADERSVVLPAALIIGGGAALGVGITVGLIGVGEASDAPASEGPEADSARVKMITGDVVAGVGLVAAAVGAVLLLTRPATPAKNAGRGSVWIAPGGAGVRGRF